MKKKRRRIRYCRWRRSAAVGEAESGDQIAGEREGKGCVKGRTAFGEGRGVVRGEGWRKNRKNDEKTFYFTKK
ncbi:hypothetical protein [Brotonthovivens ammoniilytica]|uniref:hypothetical protein n=1 Tax=Brotonthovivens ammoniilytica TaxID=2981725 RepID=UPI00130EE37E|nr:hypothetical protein [Brotonthovivens ammoniilytica]